MILQNFRADIHELASLLFDEIKNTPYPLRQDDRERTGLAILVREIGADNQIYVTVDKPSDGGKFYVSEKATRSELLEHWTSGNSADKSKRRYHGCITFLMDGKKFQVSTSGLQEHEDVAVSLRVASQLSGKKVSTIVAVIQSHDGILPEWVDNNTHYLHAVMAKIAA
ncbi:MAG: hypothetical protein KBD52_01020 [Candidatus Pacebacteria bacterium]|nr:hypothetical protein [Candidatus Paceibacterota bacterium]